MAVTQQPKTTFTDPKPHRPSDGITPEAAKAAARRAELTAKALRVLVWITLLAGAVLFLLPFYVMVAMSLKSQNEAATTSMWAWPTDLRFENFAEVWNHPGVNFSLFLRNTVFLTVVNTIGTTISCAIVAYGFARLKFPGRDRLFLVLLATMMLPGIVTMVPSYVMFAKIGWINTFLPLTVPSFFASAFFVFMLRQFYLGIPRELDEAAVLDGANHWTIFSRVISPNAAPALATVAVFTFMGTWRDFMGPLLYLNDTSMQTLEIGLRTFNSLRSEKWHLVMAASLIVVTPLIIIFFLGQKVFMKGIVLTGGK